MNAVSPKVKIEYVIVCDDVRREDNGKLIFIGVYGSDIRSSSYPLRLRLSVVVAIRSDTEQEIPISLRVKLDGKRIFESQKGYKMPVPAGDIALWSIARVPVIAEMDAMLDFQVRLDQGRFRSACKMRVRKETS